VHVKQLKSRSAVAAIAMALGALILTGPVSASDDSATPSATKNTILMKGGKDSLRFVGPDTIVAGEELTVVNQSIPRKVGPHTLSLVAESTLPKTKKQRKACFTPKHICMEIAKWHGVKGNSPPKVNPTEVGKDGWDTIGSLSRDGDSWFTGNKDGASYTAPVTVDTSRGAQTVHFICAVHAWMQGEIEVLPPASS
jgi:hypothetical protein